MKLVETVDASRKRSPPSYATVHHACSEINLLKIERKSKLESKRERFCETLSDNKRYRNDNSILVKLKCSNF